VSAVASSTATTCKVYLGCGAEAVDCTTVEVAPLAPGPCTIVVSYVDGTAFTLVSNVSHTAACCSPYSLDNRTLGT